MRFRFALTMLVLASLFAACGPPHIEPINAAAQSVVTPTCVTVQRGLASPWGTVADAQIRQDAPTTTGGTNPSSGVGGTAGATRQALIRFDLSAIPAGATVTSALLTTTLTVTRTPGVISANTITVPWAEGTVTWTSLGGAFTAPSPAISASVSPGSAGTAITLDITPIASAWLTSNNGVLLNETDGLATTIGLSEWSPAAQRPKLAICYLPAPTCSDATKNGVETDIDCGGGTCPACANGKVCAVNLDCTSGICTSGVCTSAAPPTCTNGVLDGTETDVDCGGSCGPCANGKLCSVAGDCLAASECDTWDARCHALGGASIAPVASCTLPVQTSIAPTTVAYGADPAQVVDVYVSAAPTGLCLVAIHGGGGTGGDKTDTLAVLPFAKMRAGTVGDTVFAINYRLASGTAPSVVNAFPAGLNDVRSFALWLQSNAATYGCSPSRVALVGFSMGSILAAQAATTLDLPVVGGVQYLPNGTALQDASAAAGTIRAVVSYYLGSDFTLPPSDISASSLSNLAVYFNGTSAPVYADGSPSKTIHPIATPFLVLAASGDPFLYPSQSAGTAVYPLPSGHYVLGYDPALRARGIASTFVGATTSFGTGHMFDPTASGPYLSANCTANAFLNSL
jgi:acetyl esterase/lipase